MNESSMLNIMASSRSLLRPSQIDLVHWNQKVKSGFLSNNNIDRKRGSDIVADDLKGYQDDPSLITPLESPPTKRRRTEDDASKNSVCKVPPSAVCLTSFSDNDVLSGRGGGTNQHEGNYYFRSLINLHRERYLKAKKNDKPFISRSIVNAIRKKNGRFLKKDEESDLWLEIGDDAAREKTSQALRQKAPEFRRLMLERQAKICEGWLPTSVSPEPSVRNGCVPALREDLRFPMTRDKSPAIQQKNHLIEIEKLETLTASLRKAQMLEMQQLICLKREELYKRRILDLMLQIQVNY
mmetsp:Transcript_19677/g.22803  ORF Transcript_19677/g.22803 Transcript_19677/m.22803 type:complete len:296 (+) Transcript_19677:2-889(+)